MTRNAGKQDNLKYRYVDTSHSNVPMFVNPLLKTENRKPKSHKFSKFRNFKLHKV